MKLKKSNKLKNGNLLFLYCPKTGGTYYRLFVMKPDSERFMDYWGLNRDNIISQVSTLSEENAIGLSDEICEALGIEQEDVIIEGE